MKFSAGAFARVLSVVVLFAAAAGCASGFYRLHTVPLQPATPARSASTPAPPSSGGESGGSIASRGELGPSDPYLTITAYGYTDSLLSSTSSFNPDFQIFKLDADFESPKGAFSIAIMAVDLKTGVNHAGRGQDILKAVPIDFGSNRTFNFTLKSSAVERGLADKFLAGLAVVEETGKTLSLSAGPQYAVAVSAATRVLKQFQSSSRETVHSLTITLNSPSGIVFDGPLEDKTQAIVIVPTGASPLSQSLSFFGIHDSHRDYEDRLAALSSKPLRLCANDKKKLCTRDGKPFADYAYVLLVPTVQQRISYPEFLWTRGTCQFSHDELDRYRNRLIDAEASLSASQVGTEREMLLSYENLQAIRDNIRDDRGGAVFNLINKEWSRRIITDLQGGALYGEVRDRLRQCMIEEGETYRNGVFRNYVAAREAEHKADELHDRADKLVMYRTARSQLNNLLLNAPVLRINSAEVRDRLNSDVAALENSIFQTAFEKPIGELGASNAAIQMAAERELRELLATVDCNMCRTRGQAALASVLHVAESAPGPETKVEPAVAAPEPAAGDGAVEIRVGRKMFVRVREKGG